MAGVLARGEAHHHAEGHQQERHGRAATYILTIFPKFWEQIIVYIYWVSVYLLCPVRVAVSECGPARWLVIFIHGHRYRTQIAEQ